MALLSKYVPSPTGATGITYAAAAGGGDTVANPGPGCIFIVKNGSASPITVTFAVPGSHANGVAKADLALVVAATSERCVVLGNEYAGSNGLCAITYSGVTTLTVAAVQL